MTSPNAVEIVVVADRSGSMASIVGDAIGGFNSFLKEQKSVPGEAVVSLTLFDNFIENPYSRKNLKDVEELTPLTFVPRGSTSLYDAMGQSLSALHARNPSKAIVLVITDGHENSSREYSHSQVKELVTSAEAKGWQVNFLAANIDVQQYSTLLGVSAANARGFTADAIGVADAYTNMSASTTSYRTK